MKTNNFSAPALRHIRAYDFDGTLIKGDSFILFPIFSLSPIRLVKGILKSLPTVFSWKVLKKIAASEAKERIFYNLYRGLSLAVLNEKAESFADFLDKRMIPGILKCPPEVSTGIYNVIVSASPGFWIVPWSKRHNIDRVIATEVEIDAGILTGHFSSPNCKGEEKVVRLKKEFPHLSDATVEAWGNSEDDLPLLNFADLGHYVGKIRNYNLREKDV